MFFFLLLCRPPTSTLFPYTTLFRSSRVSARRRSLVWAKGHEPLIWAAVKFCFMCRRNPADRKRTCLQSRHRCTWYEISCEETNCIIRAATAADREAATPPLALCVIV